MVQNYKKNYNNTSMILNLKVYNLILNTLSFNIFLSFANWIDFHKKKLSLNKFTFKLQFCVQGYKIVPETPKT